MAAPCTIRPLSPDDHDRWHELFTAYRDFYRLPPDPAVPQTVWQWLHDPAHELRGLVAVADVVIGIAHYRPFARPSTGTVGLWLDDLYVDPDHRGSGAGRALIGAIDAEAADGQRSVVRWITSSSNTTARHLYDRLATATDWVVYDLTPERLR